VNHVFTLKAKSGYMFLKNECMIFFECLKKKNICDKIYPFTKRKLPFEDDLHKKREKPITQHNWQVNFLIFDIWMC